MPTNCTAFNVIEGLRRRYEVFFVADACGDTDIQVHERAVERMIQAGAAPTTAAHFVYELQQDGGRQETYQGVIGILKEHPAFGIIVFFSNRALGEEIRQNNLKLGRSEQPKNAHGTA